jgi:hypothetical protein
MLTFELDGQKGMTEQVRTELKEVRDANKNLDTTKFTQEKYITEYSLRLSSL